jgi:hypothetical protein
VPTRQRALSLPNAPASACFRFRVGNLELMYVRPVQTELAQVS